jgi:hypothetical protein
MAIETERFQVAIGGEDDGVVAILLDTATGRSWRATGPDLASWQPMEFAADAPAAPVPQRAKAKLARVTAKTARRSRKAG